MWPLRFLIRSVAVAAPWSDLRRHGDQDKTPKEAPPSTLAQARPRTERADPLRHRRVPEEATVTRSATGSRVPAEDLRREIHRVVAPGYIVERGLVERGAGDAVEEGVDEAQGVGGQVHPGPGQLAPGLLSRLRACEITIGSLSTYATRARGLASCAMSWVFSAVGRQHQHRCTARYPWPPRS